MTEFVVFPAIAVICYFVGVICKTFNNETLDKFIPVICGLLGIILGITMFFTIPNFIPANNWAEAVCVGIVSGLSATGINQVYKQIKGLITGEK